MTLKRKIFPRPLYGPIKITSFSKDGLTTFHMEYLSRRFGMAFKGNDVSPTMAILALTAFSRTIRKEFLRAKADQ